MRSKKCNAFFVLLVSASIILFFIWTKRYSKIIQIRSSHPNKVVCRSCHMSRNHSLKYILYWSKYQRTKNYYFGEGQKAFILNNCPVTNCFATSNKKYLKSLDDYDAVIFSPIKHSCKNYSFPSVRKPNQRYVFAIKESPLYYRHCKEEFYAQFNYLFNWTMTYRLDSDLIWDYGIIQDKKTNKTIAPSLNPLWQNFTLTDPYYLVIAQEKLKKYPSKKIAWFVSHCKTANNREGIVKELQKYIPVDIYGKCGKPSCKRTSACYKKLEQEYKFYLSFENSVCTDYVTEKLFNILKLNVVPIVYGGANYTRHAPPYSYINIRNFNSMKNLSDYLLFLLKHPYEYAKYFSWKKYYSVSTSSPICKLCENLNHPKLGRIVPVKVYSDVKQWWFERNNKYFSYCKPDRYVPISTQ